MASLAETRITHDFAHGRRLHKLCSALGLGRTHEARAGIYYAPETRSYWFRWMGSNGERYRHQFTANPWYDMDEVEWNVLQVKVKLSTC